jgi:gamma-glutamyl:cysteine ligase YbdK (ATP-grasp superfamily)
VEAKMVEKNENGYLIVCDGLVQDTFVVEGNYKGLLFGPELEFFVVDKTTFEPKNCLDKLSGHPSFEKFIKPELAAEQIEVTVPPSDSIGELERTLTEVTRDAVETLDKNNATLLPLALFDTHQFTITSDPRYKLLIDNLGEEFRRNAVAVAADQVNIGAHDERMAFTLFNSITQILPELMAFSVASPFRGGKLNGLASNRINAYDAAITKYPHLTGLPTHVEGLEQYAKELQALPVFQHPNMFYKYSRPMPHRGVAAEIRCMDKQPTITDYLALLALSKAFVHYVMDVKPYPGELRASLGLKPLEDAFNESRRSGLSAGQYKSPELLKGFLGYFSKFLDDEARYLDPLYQRISQGDLSSQMKATSRQFGVGGLYRKMSENLIQSIK